MITIDNFIRAQNAKGVYRHDEFPAGQPPKVLTPTGRKVFKPGNELNTRILAAMEACTRIHTIWKVKVMREQVCPPQLVLVTKNKFAAKKVGSETPL